MNRSSLIRIVLTCLLLGVLGGCKDRTAPSTSRPEPLPAETPASPHEDEGAEDATRRFFHAVLAGDEATIRSLLTPEARRRADEQGIPFSPEPSRTASFTLDRAEYRDELGAYVYTTLTDRAPGTGPASTEIVWLVAKTTEGWRVAGAAMTLFDGQEKTVIDFEDPESARAAIAAAERREIERRTRNAAVRQVSW